MHTSHFESLIFMISKLKILHYLENYIDWLSFCKEDKAIQISKAAQVAKILCTKYVVGYSFSLTRQNLELFSMSLNTKLD